MTWDTEAEERRMEQAAAESRAFDAGAKAFEAYLEHLSDVVPQCALVLEVISRPGLALWLHEKFNDFCCR